MILFSLLIDPMIDDRLKKPALSYEAWHYVLTMEWLTQNQFSGFAIPSDVVIGYDGLRTPRAFALEAHAQFTMQIIDSQHAVNQWFNNYGDKPGELMPFAKPGYSMQIGRDRDCFVIQVWSGGVCVHAARCDKKAPPPPGWRG